jgi:hypothetical protein
VFDLEDLFVCQACGATGANIRPDFDRDKSLLQVDPSAPSSPRTVAHQARRAGRRSHTAGSGGLRQASRSFISSSSSRSHLRTASIRSTSVGAAGRLFDCHAISATSLRLSTGSPLFQDGDRATWQNRLNRSLLSQIAPLVRRAAKRGHKKPRPERGNGRGARYRAKPYRRISNLGPGGAYAAAKTNFSTEKGLWSNFRPTITRFEVGDCGARS